MQSLCHMPTYCTVATNPAPFQLVVVSRLWELVAVDILNVPMSCQGNQYMIGTTFQPFAISLSDQTANKIVQGPGVHIGWPSPKATF